MTEAHRSARRRDQGVVSYWICTGFAGEWGDMAEGVPPRGDLQGVRGGLAAQEKRRAWGVGVLGLGCAARFSSGVWLSQEKAYGDDEGGDGGCEEEGD